MLKTGSRWKTSRSIFPSPPGLTVICALRTIRNAFWTHWNVHGMRAPKEAGEACTPPIATFFILGWVAKRMPKLVLDIHARGHEIASHGFNHNLCYDCTPAQLREDLSESRKLLEDITGNAVHGYRAPSFSINEDVLKMIEECGYTYDSSYNSFSGNGSYGKLDLVRNGTGIAGKISSSFFELPISNVRLGNTVIPFGGGGYFRLIPAEFFLKAVRRVLDKDNAYLFYLHPWEVDPGQPRVEQAPWFFKFRHYVNLGKTLPRFAGLLKSLAGCRFMGCHDYIEQVCKPETAKNSGITD